MLSTILATKLGAAAAAGAVGLTGAAAAAYTGNLPAGLQDVAHRTIKAPPAHAKGPDASGPAAWGLCQAFAKDKENEAKGDKPTKSAQPKATDKPGRGLGRGQANGQGNAPAAGGKSKERSVAYRNLVRAAGGEDKVEAYCASIPRPSGEPDPSEQSEKAKPTRTPAHATGKPAVDSGAPKTSAQPTATATTEPATATTAPTAEPTG